MNTFTRVQGDESDISFGDEDMQRPVDETDDDPSFALDEVAVKQEQEDEDDDLYVTGEHEMDDEATESGRSDEFASEMEDELDHAPKRGSYMTYIYVHSCPSIR